MEKGKESYKPIVVRMLDPDKRDRFVALAKERGMSQSTYVRLLIHDELRRQEIWEDEVRKSKSKYDSTES